MQGLNEVIAVAYFDFLNRVRLWSWQKITRFASSEQVNVFLFEPQLISCLNQGLVMQQISCHPDGVSLWCMRQHTHKFLASAPQEQCLICREISLWLNLCWSAEFLIVKQEGSSPVFEFGTQCPWLIDLKHRIADLWETQEFQSLLGQEWVTVTGSSA